MFSTDADVPSLLAVLFVVSGLLGLGVSVLLPNPYSHTLPLAVLIAGVLFLLTRDRPTRPFGTRERTDRSFGIAPPAWILVALYFVTLAVTVLLYRFGGNQRTLPVHAAILGCYLVAAMLLLTPASRYLKIGVVLLTGGVQRALAYYSSPLYLGNDVFAHNRLAGEITATNSLEPLTASRYFYSPFYHLLVSVTEQVSGLSVRHAAFLVIAIVLVGIPAGALFLIADRTWGERTGLFAALLYTASDFAVHWAIQPQVTSLGVGLFALVLLLLVSYVGTGRERYHALYIAGFVTLALTHHLSTAIAFLSIAIFLTAVAIFRPDFRRRALWLIGISLAIVLVHFQVTDFGGPADGSESFLTAVLGIWQSSLREVSFPGEAAAGVPADAAVTLTGSAALNVWHVAGTAILFGLAVFGGLHWLSSERASRETGIAFGSIVAVLFPLVLVGPVVGLRILIPWRWFAFLYLPLVLLAAPGLGVLTDVVGDRLSRSPVGASSIAAIAAVLLVVGPYVFLMGGNALAARDGPPLDDAPGAERYAVTGPEHAALEHVAARAQGTDPVLGDFMIAHNILDRHYEQANARTIHMETSDPESIADDRRAILFNRSYMQSGHVKFRYGTEAGIGDEEGLLVHGTVPVGAISDRRRDVIYSNPDVDLLRLAPTADRNQSLEGSLQRPRVRGNSR